MRTRLLTVLLTSIVAGLASPALAQDEFDPEGGDLGGEGTELGGEEEMSTDGAESAPAGGGAEKPISVGLLLGYGISLEDGEGNPWGLGFGVRGGYNIDAIYLGARFIYYLGDSEDTPLGEVSANIWELGIEGGYDVDAGGVVIRPGLGLGIASLNAEFGGMSDSTTEVFLAPGVSVLFDVSEDIFVGADARLQLIFGEETIKALTLFANAGMRF